MTEPEPRNKSALKKPCASKCMMPAATPPTPNETIIRPSCDTVEYARIRLMSACAMAIIAAMSAVVTPVQTTTASEDVTPLIAPNEKSGYTRATRNTPAATIVAAWIRALTGVGPSIASGNQTCSGNWPDLPTAPQKIRRAINVALAPSMARPALSRQPRPPLYKSSVPLRSYNQSIPRKNPMSPMRVVMNAFFAAAAALGRSIQNPMSKYEASPTSSQKMNSNNKLLAMTAPSIAPEKND